MHIHDKRLFTRLDQHQQEKYLKDILKQIPDAADKCERVEITHEPIKLLKRKRNAHAAVSPAPSAAPHEEQ